MRLVPQTPSQRPTAPRRTAVARRAPKPPRGIAPQDRLARQARGLLAEAVRLAHWAQRAGVSPETDVRRAATELGMTEAQVRDRWSHARLAGLVEPAADGAPVTAGWRLRAWEHDDTAALRGWVALFDAWSLA
ncbi:hypothetical protein E1265_35950, partial [Streptomyces sp. 8K308]